MRCLRLCFSLALLACLCVPAIAQRFSAWSAPVNVGGPVNTGLPEYQPFITKDGLSLYFALLEGTGIPKLTPQDIWVSKRGSESEPWGNPQRLGPEINIAGNNQIEAHPFVSTDGHWLFFNSNRSIPDARGFTPLGKTDLYVSHRQNKHEEGWEPAVNLGAGVNSAGGEQGAWVFEDEETGVTTLYFNSDRAGSHDLYQATLLPDGTFGNAMPIAEQVPGTINTSFIEQHVSISRNGLEMYFISDRPGSTPYLYDPDCGTAGTPSPDIWIATRAGTSEPWGVPENLDAYNARLGGPAINSGCHDGRPSISFDGKTLYFFSAYRPGNQSIYFDIWKTTRTKLTGKAD
jgi:hypothetical protein